MPHQSAAAFCEISTVQASIVTPDGQKVTGTYLHTDSDGNFCIETGPRQVRIGKPYPVSILSDAEARRLAENSGEIS